MTLAATMQRFDDRLSPIFVKEMRQAVRGKQLSSLLYTFLAVSLLMLAGFVRDDSGADSMERGRGAFMMLNIVMLIAAVAVIPAQQAQRFNQERTAAELDLMYATPLGPGKILAGKFTSTMAMTLIIFSVCAPYAALTYLLRGIDVPTIFVVVLCDLVFAAVATWYTLCLGSYARSWIGRLISGLFGAAGVIAIVGTAMSLTGSIIFIGMGVFTSSVFWGPFLFAVVLGGFTLLVMTSAAYERIQPSPRPRYMPRPVPPRPAAAATQPAAEPAVESASSPESAAAPQEARS